MATLKTEREFTSEIERVVPGKSPPFLLLEHLVRYRFAASFASGHRVLDVGCGTGYGAAILAEKARLVVAIDNSHAAVEYAHQNYSRANLYYGVADCRGLPFPDRCFDLTVLFEVIEHFREQSRCLTEIRRVLATDGILVLSTPNIARSTKAIEDHNPFHYKELAEAELLELLQPHFRHVQLHYQHEWSASGIQAAGTEATTHLEAVEDFSVAGRAKYFLAVCSGQPLRAAVIRTLGLGGIEHQIAIVQDLRAGQRETEALLRQREENARAYAENLATHGAVIRDQEQRIAALEMRLQKEIELRDRQLAAARAENEAHRLELDWLYRWIPVNKLARKLLYGKNLRRRLLTKLRL